MKDISILDMGLALQAASLKRKGPTTRLELAERDVQIFEDMCPACFGGGRVYRGDAFKTIPIAAVCNVCCGAGRIQRKEIA